jgi:hypothetical protein
MQCQNKIFETGADKAVLAEAEQLFTLMTRFFHTPFGGSSTAQSSKSPNFYELQMKGRQRCQAIFSSKNF